MNQQIILAATMAAESQAELNATEALASAYRTVHGDSMDDIEFVKTLLYGRDQAALVRGIKANALDPDANEIEGQQQLLPMPGWVVARDDKGEELYIRGDFATVDQLHQHYTASLRQYKGKARKADQGLKKVTAMREHLVGMGVDPHEANWADVVDQHGVAVIQGIKDGRLAIEA